MNFNFNQPGVFAPGINIYHMTKIRVTKAFEFEMAHALLNYDGLCKNIHGHSYKLFVTVIGTPAPINLRNPKQGMVVDFGLLKKTVEERVLSTLDHALVLNREVAWEKLQTLGQMFDKMFIVKYQPTAENIAADIAQVLLKNLPSNLALHTVKLYETADSYVEWCAADQPQTKTADAEPGMKMPHIDPKKLKKDAEPKS